MPTTVAHLISSGGFYGAECCLFNLAAEQLESGYRVLVCVFENTHNPHTEVATKVQAVGIPARMVAYRNRFDLRAAREIRGFLRAEQVQILHCHGYKADCYGYVAAWALPTKLVATCHNWCRDSATAKYETVDKLILRAFDRVVGVNAQVADTLIRSGVASKKVRVIENGVALKSNFAVGRDANVRGHLTFATIARLAPDKRICDFLMAAADVVRTHPNLHFLVVGEGPEHPSLHALVDSLSISKQVTFTGYVSDIDRILSLIDVLVLPSLNEGMPMSILEAMSAGKAVIATRIGGIPNVVLDQVTGLLVPPANVPALAAAMETMIGSPELSFRMGARGRELVEEKFSAKRMTSRYTEVYKELIGEKTIQRAETTVERSAP